MNSSTYTQNITKITIEYRFSLWQVLSELGGLISSANNFAAYRRSLQESSSHFCIPIMWVLQRTRLFYSLRWMRLYSGESICSWSRHAALQYIHVHVNRYIVLFMHNMYMYIYKYTITSIYGCEWLITSFIHVYDCSNNSYAVTNYVYILDSGSRVLLRDH